MPHELCVLLTSTPDDINSTVVGSPLQSTGCELCHLDDKILTATNALKTMPRLTLKDLKCYQYAQTNVM